MISDEEIKVGIDVAEKMLLKCFDRLLVLKHADGDLTDAILEFQPQLADCLYKLMELYKRLKAEKKQLIAEKLSFCQSDFRRAMALNNDFSEAIKHAIEIGKSIGDAFAWFFYRDNFSELGKHFQHKPTGLFTAGIGGRGEIDFIRNNQNFNGLFVLYHGITSMLRVGDFSLYGLDAGIIGIGEIKTEKSEKTLKINAHISSKVILEVPQNIQNTNLKHIEKSTDIPWNMPRLNKQLLIQDELLFAKKADNIIKHQTEYEYALLNQLKNDSSIAINEDSTLLLLSTKTRSQGLFQNLMEKENDYKLPKGFQSAAEKIIQSGNDNNRAIIGTIDTIMTHARIPIFWWDIDDEICRDIYFKKLHITTVFNPANLVQYFIDAGYSIVESKDIRKIKLQRIQEDKTMELGNFELFFDLVSHSLMKTQYVIKMIDQFLLDVERAKYPPNSKIEMMIQLHTFGEMH